MRRINTLYVEGRIGLCIAKCLGLFQHIGELPLLIHHLREYEIAGAIDDARKPVNPVCSKTLTQRFYDRNTACHRALIGERDVILLGQFDKRSSSLGD